MPIFRPFLALFIASSTALAASPQAAPQAPGDTFWTQAAPASVARSVIKMGLAMGGEHGQAMEGLNMEEITRMVDEMMLSGQTGDIINVDSDDAKVRIYLE